LTRGADWIVLGEGEVTLGELVAALVAEADATDIPGLCFRGAGGTLVRTAARPFIRDLDGLPRPAWDLVDVESYRRVWRERHGYHSMNLVTTRGCPYHCNWCAKPIYGQRYAVRSPEAVADEVAWLRDSYAPDHLAFADDIFGLKPGWVERFAEALVVRGAVVPFKCLSRVDLLSGPVVAALRRAGCRTVWVGAESGSQRVLDAMEKGTRVEQIEDAAERLHAAEIEVGFFLQFGYPGETRDDVERTLAMVRRCRPDDIGVSVSYPLPGTPFYERVKADLGGKTNWQDSDDLAMLYRGPYTTEFYRTLYRVVHKEFRIRRLRESLSRGRRGSPRGRNPVRQAAALAFHAVTLPLERRRLARLERVGHAGVAALPPALTPERAARPSEQAP
jgi:radical SAM superfamily enzyme YgiQ (UPF0313 family)